MADLDYAKAAGADLERRTLSCIPSLFGRLAYLASLLDRNSGRYTHFGLEQIHGADQANQALRIAHEDSLSRWLCLSLREQYEDVLLYLEGLSTDPSRVVRYWARQAPYRDLLPAGASGPERELYLAEVEVILELLLGKPAGSAETEKRGVLTSVEVGY